MNHDESTLALFEDAMTHIANGTMPSSMTPSVYAVHMACAQALAKRDDVSRARLLYSYATNPKQVALHSSGVAVGLALERVQELWTEGGAPRPLTLEEMADIAAICVPDYYNALAAEPLARMAAAGITA